MCTNQYQSNLLKTYDCKIFVPHAWQYFYCNERNSKCIFIKSSDHDHWGQRKTIVNVEILDIFMISFKYM